VELVAQYRDAEDRARIVGLDAFARGGLVVAGRDIPDDPNSEAAVSIVTAYDDQGRSQWTKVAERSLRAVAVDDEENVVTLAAHDGLVQKLDRAGEVVWERSIPGAWELASIGSSPDGELALTLLAYPVTEWQGEGCPYDAPVGQVCIGIDQPAEGALIKLDEAGDELWRLGLRAVQFSFPWDVALDSAGNVTTVGPFVQDIDIGDGLVSADATNASMLASFDESGEIRFRSVLENAMARNVAVDSGGDTLIAGSFSGEMSLDGEELGDGNDQGLFVAKLDASGKLRWAKTYEGRPKTFMQSVHTSGAVDVFDFTVDPFDNVVVAGRFDGELGELSAPAPGAAFLIKLTSEGDLVWSKVYAAWQGASARHVASDAAGSLFVGGAFRGETDFGDGWVLSAEDDSFYFAKFLP
jgi:hypothetical protein